MTDMIPTRSSVLAPPRTADEAAVWYAATLGWPVTPGNDPSDPDPDSYVGATAPRSAVAMAHDQSAPNVSAPNMAAPSETVANVTGPNVTAWLSPGPWQWAASSLPTIVRAVWRLSPGAPVLAALGRTVPWALRLGIVDVPALVGVAALERLGKNPSAAGPITDGQGRIRFLVDLGEDEEPEYGLAKWREVGVDLRVWGRGRYCPLPTPGAVGPSWVVWAIPPDPDRRTLPHARQVTAVLDRAVRDAYPSLWDVVVRTHP
jgi:hypothetical protein